MWYATRDLWRYVVLVYTMQGNPPQRMPYRTKIETYHKGDPVPWMEASHDYITLGWVEWRDRSPS